mmetsp:Transcript_16023/g.28324  ORF Transcript_16023/g.28324 Transcript_16023/m.28324 type:complete len:85 (+) Transcript_16023:49-303(+)
MQGVGFRQKNCFHKKKYYSHTHMFMIKMLSETGGRQALLCSWALLAAANSNETEKIKKRPFLLSPPVLLKIPLSTKPPAGVTLL